MLDLFKLRIKVMGPAAAIVEYIFAAIKFRGIIRLKELIREKTVSGSTILIASHMLDFLENICDRTIFIKDGKIVGDYENTDNLEEIYKEKFL